MRKWTHDELHALMDSNPILKERSDKIHSLPDSDSITGWLEGKKLMMSVYAEAVGCSKTKDAIEFLCSVFVHIKKYSRTKKEWHTLPPSPETSGAIEQMAKVTANNKICHSPGGNDYLCFCDEKTA